MQGVTPPSLLKCITLLTLLCSDKVLARPGIVPEYYTVVNGKQSFLPIALQDSTTGPDNQGGPAIPTSPATMVVVYQTVTASAVVTQMSTVMATAGAAKSAVAVPVAQGSNGAVFASSAQSFTTITNIAIVNTIVAASVAASTSTVLALSSSSAKASSPVLASSPLVVVSTSPAAAVTQGSQGGIFIQQPVVIPTSSAVTLSVAGSMFTTVLSAQTTAVSLGLPTVTHTAVAATVVPANPNLPCYGSNDVITAFEQANIGTPLTYQIKNSCPYSVWPVATYHLWPNSGEVTYHTMGELKAYGGLYTWSDSPYWMTSARLWAKEGCDANGNNCVVDAGNAPTLFEWTIYPDALAQCSTEINYDISLVDGHTIPIGITFDSSTCPSRTCTASKTVNGTCPNADLNKINGVVEGCLSSCSYLQSIGVFSGEAFELACCAGAHNTAETCPATSSWFADACPEAYSYAYDDIAANRACSLPGKVMIEYCPFGSVP